MSSPSGAPARQFILPALTCDNTREVLPAGGVHLSFDVQGLIGVNDIGMCAFGIDLSYSDASPPEQKQVFPINHIVSVNYQGNWACVASGLSAHLPAASQGLVLKTDLS